MRFNSLAFRLFASAAAWTLIVLPITAIILISLFRGAVERSFDARLNTYLTDLLAETLDPQTGELLPPPDLGVSEFNLPLTGWYWQITPIVEGGGPVRPLFSSTSLLAEVLKLPSSNGAEIDTEGLLRANITGPKGQQLRVVEREVALAGEGKRERYSFAVAGNGEEVEKEIDDFKFIAISALTVLGIGLAFATLFQVKFGLSPLGTMQAGLSAIRSGKAEKLEGEYPVEINPLQRELNALILSNQDIVERSRTHVGNLAHALKTPLSVITNESRKSRTGLGRKVADQAQMMETQISHHLDRARMAARVRVIGDVTEVAPVLGGLARAVKRIYKDAGIEVRVSCPKELKFQGEKQDLEEMVGNLLDNACKWAKSRVAVTAGIHEGEHDGAARQLIIDVDDDGPGLSKAQRSQVVQRGKRLDETKPGSGLGLSIVADLAHLYRGTLELDISPQKGLRARLLLPLA